MQPCLACVPGMFFRHKTKGGDTHGCCCIPHPSHSCAQPARRPGCGAAGLAGAGPRPGHARAGRRRLSGPAHQAGRSLHARRRHRRDRARGGAKTLAGAGPARGGGEPGGRGRQSGRRRRGQGKARWLYAAAGCADQPFHQQRAHGVHGRLHHGQELCAHWRGGPRAAGGDRGPVGEVGQSRGAHRAGQNQAGRAELRLLGQWLAPAPGGRAVQAAGGRAADPCALQGQHAGAQRSDGRPGGCGVRHPARHAGLHQGRPPARPGRDHGAARALPLPTFPPRPRPGCRASR